jgi:hypothetical protein
MLLLLSVQVRSFCFLMVQAHLPLSETYPCVDTASRIPDKDKHSSSPGHPPKMADIDPWYTWRGYQHGHPQPTYPTQPPVAVPFHRNEYIPGPPPRAARSRPSTRPVIVPESSNRRNPQPAVRRNRPPKPAEPVRTTSKVQKVDLEFLGTTSKTWRSDWKIRKL